MRTPLLMIGATLLALCNAAPAAEYRFELLDLARFDSHHSEHPKQRFRGTGFVGMTDYRWSDLGHTWVHALHLATAEDARTLMQLNLAPLAGERIVSATLSFRVLHGQDTPGEADVRISGYRTDGRLKLQWDAPADSHGAVIGRINNLTQEPQQIDITPLVDGAVRQGHRWLGLHLQSLGEAALYTATHDYPNLLYPDRAEVRIVVVTGPVSSATSR